MPLKLKSSLFNKKALDPTLEALNDPDTATNDPRAVDDDYPYTNSGTELRENTLKSAFGPIKPKDYDPAKVKRRELEDDFLIEGNPQRIGLGHHPLITLEPEPKYDGKITCKHCSEIIPVYSGVMMAQHMRDVHPDKWKTSNAKVALFNDDDFMAELGQESVSEQIYDAEEEAYAAFMEDVDMRELAKNMQIDMERLWAEEKKQYCDDYFASKNASKSCVACESGECLSHQEPPVSPEDANFFKESENELEIERKSADVQTKQYGTGTSVGQPAPTPVTPPAPPQPGQKPQPVPQQPASTVQPPTPLTTAPSPEAGVVPIMLPSAGQKQQMKNTASSKPVMATLTIEHLRVGHPIDADAIKTAVEHALGAKYFVSNMETHVAAVEMHETPRSLPPRDDMRRHLDEEVKNESMEGVMDGVKDEPKTAEVETQISTPSTPPPAYPESLSTESGQECPNCHKRNSNAVDNGLVECIACGAFFAI
jgi:hypothetical protein